MFKLPPLTPPPATEPPLMKSGDRAERLTFLGITAAGKALCRCDCGELEAFSPSLIAEPLKPRSRRRLAPRHLLRCSKCRPIFAALKA